ncbi:peptidoglycan DD-metalloendopeptidase family protein [Alphaproteobacteria bacterium]|nr:peptidoglycan DD-metalloendopeptidase family protein [Alphaproteobacteria bacterium]
MSTFQICSSYAKEETEKEKYFKELENIKALIIEDKHRIKNLNKKLQNISNNIKNIRNNIDYNNKKIKEYTIKKNLLTNNLSEVENLINNLKISKKEYESILDRLLLLVFINKKFNYDINIKKKIILDYLLNENINNHDQLNKAISNSLDKLFIVKKEIKNINEHIFDISKKSTIQDLLVINTASEAITISRKRSLTNIINKNENQKDKITKILSSLKKNYTQKPLEKIIWNKFYNNNLLLPFKNMRKPEGVIYKFTKQTEIISPVSGKVVFSNYFKGHKNMFIIDPGFGFHVILSGLDKIYYKNGANINVGEKIGIIRINKSNSSELYVEVRHKGNPINPLKWLIKKNSKGK